MRSLLKLFIFILAFQVEIRVRASGGIVQEPDFCMKDNVKVCAIQVLDNAFHLKSNDLSLHASKGSALLRADDQKWHLVRGVLWVEDAGEFEFKTPFVSVKADSGQFWMLGKKQKTVIRNIDAEMSITLADGKKLELPRGFEFWVSGINTDGVNEYGMIQPIELKEHLRLWNLLYAGSKKSFVNQARDLNKSWGNLFDKSAYIYKEEIDRKIAAANEDIEKKKQIKTEQIIRDQKSRKVYYERTFGR